MNCEKLIEAAFNFDLGYPTSSIANQTKSLGQIRQEKFQDLLDRVVDARTRIGSIRKNNELAYEILRLRFGKDSEIPVIAEKLKVTISEVNEIINQSFDYICDESGEIPNLKKVFDKPTRSRLESGTPILILEGKLSGTRGDFLDFENNLKDRLVIRYFAGNKEQITIQNMSEIDWN